MSFPFFYIYGKALGCITRDYGTKEVQEEGRGGGSLRNLTSSILITDKDVETVLESLDLITSSVNSTSMCTLHSERCWSASRVGWRDTMARLSSSPARYTLKSSIIPS